MAVDPEKISQPSPLRTVRDSPVSMDSSSSSPSVHDLRVRGHLFARTDPHEITEHDIVVRYFNVFAVAVHKIVGSHQNRQFVKSTLGFQFGADAYAGIDDDDHAEHRVSPRSSDQYHNHGRKDDAVEQGEHVGSHDIDKRT